MFRKSFFLPNNVAELSTKQVVNYEASSWVKIRNLRINDAAQVIIFIYPDRLHSHREKTHR